MLAVDLTGTPAPFVPAVGAVRHLGKLDNVADAAKALDKTIDAAKAGDKAADAGKAAARTADAAGALQNHHLLPQQFREYFERAGLNIEEYTVQFSKQDHILKPGGVHTSSGGNWNKQWKKFIEENPKATSEQILDHMNTVRQEFGI